MTTAAHATHSASTTASSAEDLNTGSGVSPLPEWLAQTDSGQRIALAKEVTLWREEHAAILRIEMGADEYVEFELDPSGIPPTLDEALEEVKAELSKSPGERLLQQAMFRSLAEFHKVRSLRASGEKVQLDLLLSENAQIEGEFRDSFIGLYGTSVELSQFSISGVSALHLSCGELVCDKAAISEETALSGRVKKMSVRGDGTRIASHHARAFAIEQFERGAEVTDRTSTIFKGMVFSKENINPEIFMGRTLDLKKDQVVDLIHAHNAKFLSAHLGEEELSPKGTKKSRGLDIAAASEATPTSVTRRYLPLDEKSSAVECLVVSLSLPARIPLPPEMEPTLSKPKRTPRLCLLIPHEESEEGTPHDVNNARARCGFLIPEGKNTDRFVEFLEQDRRPLLYSYALWDLLRMYGRRKEELYGEFLEKAIDSGATKVI